MVINQYGAIGDILFLEPMFRYFWNKNGVKPIVPVHDHLFWIADYIESADFRKKSEFSLDYDSTDMNNEYFPARYANQIYRKLDKNDHSDLENMMLDKYRLAGLDPELWKTIKLKFDDRAIPSNGTGYRLINENCQAGRINIYPFPNGILQNKYMIDLPGFTVIDWWKKMLNADENHHVSTCTFFIFQALQNEFGLNWWKPVFIYPRPNEDGLRGIINLKPDFNLTLVHG